MTPAPPLDRRTFLADLGHGAFVLAIVGIAGCSPTVISSFAASPQPTSDEPSRTGGGASGGPSGPPAAGGVSWARVNLGFVSAYLLVRGGEAALVDTGVAGSEGAIETALTDVGLGWPALAHVVLTHHHNDHQGSAVAVLGRAPGATLYAGAEDIPQIQAAPATAVRDGDSVFALRIVTTPGHTQGSICVLDQVAGVLVAGDALRSDGGRPGLPGSQFTVDMAEAKRSIVKLGALTFETLLVGHGEPVEGNAAALVAELGASA